jgi:acetyl-CoA C-acetyltransferase
MVAIAVAAHQIVEEGADIMVGCGVDSISFQGGGGGGRDETLTDTHPAIWMPMIETADIVAERYKISREYQDEYSLQSQQRMAAAQAAGKFKDEIISVRTKMKVVDKATKAESFVDAVVDRDECNRPETTLEGLAKLEPVKGAGKFVTAGNASQLSDGAAAVVLMEAKEAERRGLQPLGAFKGWAVAGCEPDEMGIGPVFAVPRLLRSSALHFPAKKSAYSGVSKSTSTHFARFPGDWSPKNCLASSAVGRRPAMSRVTRRRKVASSAMPEGGIPISRSLLKTSVST